MFVVAGEVTVAFEYEPLPPATDASVLSECAK
jgi:hypothetical protein